VPRSSCYPAYVRHTLLVGIALTLAGCAGQTSNGTLTVFAAASLQDAFDRYASQLGGGAHLSFAGSDMLAAQIEQGVHPDVFAAADTALPERLYGKGLVERPLVFASNRLVLAVGASEARISSLADVERAGMTLAIGEPGVPVGLYTRELIARLPRAQRERLTRKVRDVEPDVSGIVGKLAEGAVDAGFLYVTDVTAAQGRLRAIGLPEALQPDVAYAIAVVKDSAHARAARRFVDGLIAGPGAGDLRADGFSLPGGE
jgi:molybdate transport system substrate-binding protein